jgi:alkaline phosphatase D
MAQGKLTSRRELLQLLSVGGAALVTGCAVEDTDAASSGTDAGAAAQPDPCVPVGQGAKVSHGPISGGATAAAVRLAVRLSGPATVQFELTTSGGAQTIRSSCVTAQQAEDFAVICEAAGLQPQTVYTATPIIDGVADPQRAITTRTFAPAGQATDFSFVFGSCCRYDDEGGATHSGGKVFEVAASLPETPWFFAQIGDWTYPDYAFAAFNTKSGGGLDAQGNNYTAYPAEIAKAWRRKLTDNYPIRKLIAKVPMAHVWDDHDFAQNNADNTVTGKQSDRIAGLQRYFPSYALPKSQAGAWQRFSVGHCDFFLTDMRSQRTPIDKALIPEKKPDGATIFKLVEPPGHGVLGAEQMAWLVDGLTQSKATWKFVFLPVEINPRYDILMDKALNELPIPALVEALGDTWCGYPTERKQLLDLHTSGKVKNIVFLTGDAHMAAMKPRDADCPPVFMAANLDIDQAPIMDLVANFGVDTKALWP